ncbi:tRNA (adenosine(37)-N6)-threonylcarbamoyltransferase complex dimerization subunit type 1 TsaB [Qipengyuania marisflavi]|uniref:tRNA (Adenosine(37)-N6)-threonylcarbamoyltransferase complex dimerization subunit type 1 TsaB n=1 Tax=Qipengyuania marisflavi TaxID=2486356 RepID=A0A5S3PA17_9SPHN|nr:tRNA (adenosine(37)-N6)-threonylcarbamoyltransferase complex dimerization subunit type 1 TsaB [Qipengyuania marisflavi]TMM50301.1 tRNA (adenosine(37)-N6)-threonylcarbamoyltransferase complex dimerization subunit type 1 TsaB [Qipengyuania marisflavi]
MRILAIETATEACSVALFEDGALRDARHVVLGRGHAERLVPLIAELPDKGRAEKILVSLGPGSFTGTRIGLAAARALGVAWSSIVRGYPTLALVAAMARAQYPGPVSVCMAGGHGEWFMQDFAGDGLPEMALVSLRPDAVTTCCNHPTIAGNRAREKGEIAGSDHRVLDILPDARFALQIPAALLTDALAPLYGRPPDAKLPA